MLTRRQFGQMVGVGSLGAVLAKAPAASRRMATSSGQQPTLQTWRTWMRITPRHTGSHSGGHGVQRVDSVCTRHR